MVTIKDYKIITKDDGEKFYVLIVQGGVEPTKSENTGRLYFTARTATVPTTFDESTCKSAVGTSFEGQIQKVQCESYEYTVESTGEVITLSHKWQYIDDEQAALNEHVVQSTEKIM